MKIVDRIDEAARLKEALAREDSIRELPGYYVTASQILYGSSSDSIWQSPMFNVRGSYIVYRSL